jgi:hypothetical protein
MSYHDYATYSDSSALDAAGVTSERGHYETRLFDFLGKSL